MPKASIIVERLSWAPEAPISNDARGFQWAPLTTEPHLQTVFEPFGELDFDLQKNENSRSHVCGFVQCRDTGQAREALESNTTTRSAPVVVAAHTQVPNSTVDILLRREEMLKTMLSTHANSIVAMGSDNHPQPIDLRPSRRLFLFQLCCNGADSAFQQLNPR
ncbi:hypothetical protein B0H63DRAFT_16833 [Podospora didyma]|uniref:RRM domain-containing protein n=1 Tax=Podospora didyma TaxID=330526 RepID=A0AAE0U7K8_9PEZI|nr:hypothetical protein B0H63DRAFT_16833 [Podospora didyma]